MTYDQWKCDLGWTEYEDEEEEGEPEPSEEEYAFMDWCDQMLEREEEELSEEEYLLQFISTLCVS